MSKVIIFYAFVVCYCVLHLDFEAKRNSLQSLVFFYNISESLSTVPLVYSKREGGTFLGLALLTSQKWWFSVANWDAPVRGMQRGKLL